MDPCFCCFGKARSEARLDGKTVIITGGNTGIGLETAKDLAKRGARVILACRNAEKGEAAAKEVKEFSGNDNVVVRTLDLASFQSVRNFAKQIVEEEQRLDVLINNAGVAFCPYAKTEDGFEMQFGTNHLGHFLLTNLLLDLLKASPPSRIITVASLGYRLADKGIVFKDINGEKDYNKYYAYFQSKLANILFTRELHKKLEGTQVTAYVLHPGTAKTELSRHMNWCLLCFCLCCLLCCTKTLEQEAQTSIYCAVTEGIEKDSGKYFSECAVTNPSSRFATDDEAAKRLWEISSEMTGL